MGYFDALTSGSFKTTEDGRRLFFPWGVLGKGYSVASEQDYRRLQKQVKGYMIVSLVLIIASGSFGGYFDDSVIPAPVAVGALVLALYLAWIWHVLGRLTVSDESLSLKESVTSQASALGVVMLWLMEVAALAFVASGIFMLVVDPRLWPIALSGIILFGISAAKTTYMLLLRRRTRGVER
jgi:hypothetical protein